MYNLNFKIIPFYHSRSTRPLSCFLLSFFSIYTMEIILAMNMDWNVNFFVESTGDVRWPFAFFIVFKIIYQMQPIRILKCWIVLRFNFKLISIIQTETIFSSNFLTQMITKWMVGWINEWLKNIKMDGCWEISLTNSWKFPLEGNWTEKKRNEIKNCKEMQWS